MRLVFVTQAVDADHPNLAATIDMLRALAARFDAVDVVTDRVLRHDLPANVSFRAFGAPGRAGRLVRFAAATRAALAARPDALLAHMVPLYVLIAYPFARPRRVPLLLWYTHWRSDWSLRLATRLCDAALTVDRRSFPLDSPKVRPIGHGIDLARFGGAGAGGNGAVSFVALGRTQPWKGLETLLRGFELASLQGLDGRLEIRGPQLTDEERRHRVELERIVAASQVLGERVRIEDAVGRERIPELLEGADALVSAADPGGGAQALDKVVYEASAAAVPVIACNPALSEYLDDLPVELRFRPGDAADLAARLRAFAAADPADRMRTGEELRRRVAADHSVESWADAVADVVRGLRVR
jgi:glycosyltransferase involved in cell wall biosynthesis